jgi:ABC-type nitrate/sulfonate/bicarbonate transport system substrate-binding protein
MSIVGRLSRRRFLRGTGAAALGAAGGIACPRLVFAQNKKAIKFTLAWVAEGGSLFTFVAKGMGFWDKHGLDVEREPRANEGSAAPSEWGPATT